MIKDGGKSKYKRFTCTLCACEITYIKNIYYLWVYYLCTLVYRSQNTVFTSYCCHSKTKLHMTFPSMRFPNDHICKNFRAILYVILFPLVWVLLDSAGKVWGIIFVFSLLLSISGWPRKCSVSHGEEGFVYLSIDRLWLDK